MKYPILIALLGLLLCGVGLFAEQGANPQVPINKRAAKSHGATQKVKPEQPKEDQRTTPSVAPPIPDQVSAEKTNAEAAQFKENIEIQRKLVTVTRWLVWVGIVQALILIVQAITFFCTLKGINRQVAQMIASGKQTDELINTMRDTAKAIEKQADLMEGGLHVDGVRVIEFQDGRQPVFFVKIVNSGMVAAKNVSVSVKVEFPDSTTEYKRDQVMVIPAHGWRECFIPSRIVLKEGDLSRLERDEMILRVSGRVTRDNETIEYCYKYNGWQFGDRPAKLPRFVTCDFDTQVAMSAIARIAAGASVTASAGTPTIRAENPEQTPKEPTEPN